ncbi:MAG: hypothetical protein M1814_003946 [Vezdaea aestivalis]|nr:MAG: hypothetical protein M1814_003946 [Vezdaea aestivalis]
MNVSKYELLQSILPQDSSTGESGDWGQQRWLVRRRKDAALFLAQEIDSTVFLREVEENLKALLDHPNLIRLVDVVWEYSDFNRQADYTVHEYCEEGTLENLFRFCHPPPSPGSPQEWMPETLCWHVLEGMAKALRWLHTGVKSFKVLSQDLERDFDWQSIYVMRIEPGHIYFRAKEAGKMYGQVKLGNLNHAKLGATKGADVIPPAEVFELRSCNPPEIKDQTNIWTAKAEVFCLGALVYTMMTGSPPELQKMANGSTVIQALPTEYSTQLRTLVRKMLDAEPINRPSSSELVVKVGQGLQFWSDTSQVAKQYLSQKW